MMSRLLLLLIFIEEAFDTAFGVYELMFAGKKRMAIRANFDLDVRLSRPSFHYVAASTSHGCFCILRMNTLFHNVLGVTKS
jgi:hypothetical protein